MKTKVKEKIKNILQNEFSERPLSLEERPWGFFGDTALCIVEGEKIICGISDMVISDLLYVKEHGDTSIDVMNEIVSAIRYELNRNVV